MVYTTSASVLDGMRRTYVCTRCHDIVEVSHPGEGLRHHKGRSRADRRCRGRLEPFYGMVLR